MSVYYYIDIVIYISPITSIVVDDVQCKTPSKTIFIIIINYDYAKK